jgi:hypothetical protein
LIIEGIDLGLRNRPSVDNPTAWLSVGISMAGDVTKLDVGIEDQIIPCTFGRVTTAKKDQLQTALGLKQYETVVITTDSGDGLNYGATGVVSTLFYVANSYRAELVAPGYWLVNFSLRRIV